LGGANLRAALLVLGNCVLSVVQPVFQCHTDRAVSGVHETSFPKLYRLLVLGKQRNVCQSICIASSRCVVRSDDFDDLQRGSDRRVCA
jgi:hypothetical protein